MLLLKLLLLGSQRQSKLLLKLLLDGSQRQSGSKKEDELDSSHRQSIPEELLLMLSHKQS